MEAVREIEKQAIYKVCEIFKSIQGEGDVIGIPSLFVRMYGCNLTCTWCDTKYSWIDQQRAREGIEYVNMSSKQILHSLSDYDNTSLVTITGGEPLLQPLGDLIDSLHESSYKVLIETNGTIAPSKEMAKHVSIWSVSPKTSNAGFLIKYGKMDWLSDVKEYYLKFVVVDPRKDITEILAFLDARDIDHSRVILQPNGMKEDYIDALKDLMNFVEDEGLQFRVLPQLHRLAWGHKRAV